MDELKPCPFCGSNAKVWKLKHRSKQLANFCVAEWQFDYEVICTNNRCNARSVHTETEEAAIKAWNRRVTDESERKAD